MKSNSKTLAIAIITFCIAALSLIIGCSGSKIINDDTTGLQIAINTHDTFSKPNEITFFLVVVSDPVSEETLTAASLLLNGSFLEGTLDSIPANQPLKFTVQARDRTEIVIYEGSVITSIAADQVNQIDVPMRPVVPMMNITPRYFDFTNLPAQVDSTFTFDVRVFNIDSLFETTFRIGFDELFCTIDSVVLSSDLLADSVIFFHNFVDIFPTQYTVSIAPNGIFQPLVDSNGDGTLVRFFFRTVLSGQAQTNLSTISLQIMSMAKSDPDNTININTIEVDQCLLEFTAVPQ